MTTIEVYADITCPFTHVGLKQVARHLDEMAVPADVIVRAWPLEWVNGQPLDAAAVALKARALSEQLGVEDFAGLRDDRWPDTTIPALNLAAIAYERDNITGWAVSNALRVALFEHGLDVSDPEVLEAIGAAHGLPAPPIEPIERVTAEYQSGIARGVQGSPHFFVADDAFFCPALDLGHDAAGQLTARFDEQQLAAFFARIDASTAGPGR